VHDVQVEVVDTQIGQLLAGDGLDLLAVVEAVPQLGDEEEVLALDDTLLDGTSDTLADLDLIAVVWKGIGLAGYSSLDYLGGNFAGRIGSTYHRHHRTGGNQP
jgi:hypothetical protein